MEKECRKYAQRVVAEIEAIYNGTTEAVSKGFPLKKPYSMNIF